jgi:hypothetical protein
MGFECSAIRQYGGSNPRIKSGGRAIGIAWKAIGWFATADRDRGLPPAWMPIQSGLWRPFEAGRHHRVWRSTRQASAIILLTAEVPAASEGVKSLRIILAGRSVRNPRGLISRDGPVQPRGPQPTTGSVIRTGWCRRRAVNAVPAGKRFDSFHFPPCGRSSMAEHHVANVGTMGSISHRPLQFAEEANLVKAPR